nr:hypothetical protein [Tanacetum cinerariifolium]
MTRLLPSDMVKNLKLNTNLTSSTRFHPARDPQISSNSFKSVNAIQTCFKSNTFDKKDQLQVNTLMVIENETPTRKEPKKTLEDEFADLHLNRPVLKVLAHVPMYDVILDKYIVSLELGENGSEYIQTIAFEKMKDPGLFILPCRLGVSNPFDALAYLGSCVKLLPLKLFKELKVRLLEETDDVLGLADRTKSYPVRIVTNVEKAKMAVGEGLTRLIFKVKELDFGDDNEPYWTTIGNHKSYKPRTSEDGIGTQPPYYAKRNLWNNHLPEEWKIAKDSRVNPFKDVLVFKKMVEFLRAIPVNLKETCGNRKT